MASLCLLDENGAMARRWELGDKPVTVGRGISADVSVNDATLSRHHFVVQRSGEAYLLKDLQSQNGTWVDGRPAKDTLLRHHDCILAGRTIFLFSAKEPLAAAEPAKKG
jgi:pSer/pThr/pTyr-binding forkhead associated (FHA) protein